MNYSSSDIWAKSSSPATTPSSSPAQASSSLPWYYNAATEKENAERMATANQNFNSLMNRTFGSSSGWSSGSTVNPVSTAVRDQILSDLGIDSSGNYVGLSTISLPDAPTYEAPEVDDETVSKYQQSALAPMLTKLRSALNQNVVAAKNEDNPNVRKMYTGAAMSGYGQGLSQASASARKSGLNEYMQTEYNPSVQAAQQNHSADLSKWQAEATDLINRRNRALSALSSYRS